MAIRKIAEIELKAGPYGRSEAVGSGFKFYSYDKDSAAIDLYFINQDGSPTDIMNCKTELMLLIKENDVQKKITVIDSEVEIISALKGHARYVIPDRLRGYVGLVQGYVYLNFPDESRTDECRFDFTIERSLIEEEFENGGDYYIKDIQVIFDEVKDTLNSKIPEMQTEYDNLVKTFTDYANEKIAEYDSRFVTLNSNLLTLQDSLTTAQNKVTTLEQSITTANTNLNARIDEISKKIDDNDVFTKTDASKFRADIAEVTAQLAHKVGGGRKAEPEDLSATTLGLITGTGGPINLLSIPQDNSVTPEKTTFAYFPVAHKNLFDKTSPYRKTGQYYDISGSLVSGASYNVTHSIDCKVGDVFYTNLNNYFSVGSYGAWFGADNTVISAITVNKFDTYMTITAPSGAVKFELNYHRQNSQDSLMITKNEFPKQYVEYFGNYKYKLNENIIDVTEFKSDSPIYSLNPLFGKTAVWDGDSIANGSSANDGLSGWAGRIMTRNNMTGKNYAKNGATITGGTSASHQICRNVSNIIAEYPDADYIILEGGANDTDILLEDETKIGAISDNYTGFNDTTFFGAIESLFSQVLTQYSGKKVGFIIAPKMAYQGHGYYNTSKYRKYFDRIIEVCKKWGVPYLDLWYTTHLNPTFDDNTKMYVDGQHLTSAGYEYLTPIIESWMKTL